VWSPERAKVVGIARAWWRDDREEVVTRLEHWNWLRIQIPELSTELKNFLEKMRSKTA
jgi:hypothetical protein